MFRFARTLEDRGTQYLLRAANHSHFVGLGLPCGPATCVSVDTYVTRPDGDWDNLRLVLSCPGPVAMLQVLECFSADHAREARRILLARYRNVLTVPEQAAAIQALGQLVAARILEVYGACGGG